MLKAKRLLAVVLMLAMLVTMASFPAFAANDLAAKETVQITAASATNDGSDAAMVIDGYGLTVTKGNYSVHKTPSVAVGDGTTVLTSVVIDLGAEYNLNKMFARFGSNVMRKGVLSASDDNATWTEIATLDSIAYSTETVNWSLSFEKALSMTGCYRYVKLDITEVKSAGQVPIYELVFYGNKKIENPVEYTVKFINEKGREVAPSQKFVNEDGALVSESAVHASGYMYVGDAITQSITLNANGTNEIIFEYIAVPKPEAAKLELTASNISWLSAIATSASFNNGDISSMVDGDTTSTSKTGFVSGNGYGNGAYTFVIDLGAAYDVETLKLYWGNGKESWNLVPSGDYTVSVAGPDGVYGDALYTFSDPGSTAASAVVPAGRERNDSVSLSGKAQYAQYIKVTSTSNYKRRLTIREVEVYGAKAVSSTNSAMITLNYVDDNNNVIAEPEVLIGELGETITVVPTPVNGYKYIGTINLDVLLEERAKNYVLDLVHTAIPNVSDLPVEDGAFSENASNVPFRFVIATPKNVTPADVFAVEKWVVDNCVIDSVEIVAADDPATLVYEWNAVVNVKPNNNDAFSLELDLPDEYELTDVVRFYRESDSTLLDSAIAAGQNTITLSKNKITLNYKEDGTLTDESAKVENRTINMIIDVQYILENELPYKGYDDVVIELKEFKSKGDRVRYYLDEFVRVGDQYIASLLVTKAGVDQVEATIGLYGVKANGTKVELGTCTIYSDIINIEAKYPEIKTLAQTLKDYTFPMDVLDQLIEKVHPADLPTYSDDEWAFFKEILIARGWKEANATTEIERVRNLLEAELANLEDPNWVPTKEYADDTVSIINGYYKANSSDYQRVIRMGTEVWNLMTSLHVDSFSVYGPIDRPTGKALQTGFENDIVDAYITFREGIDYNYGEKWDTNNGFCVRMKFVGASAEYANVTLGNAYNSVRRALNNDQLSPILFRLDWYNWAKNPFEGGVITVKITEDWADNYGLFNLATYHMAGYKYSEDNDPELTLMEDGIAINNPFVREVSVTFEGAAAMYDTYVIVSTNKLPSELPEQIGVYYDVE